jgi:hypothetical protein
MRKMKKYIALSLTIALLFTGVLAISPQRIASAISQIMGVAVAQVECCFWIKGCDFPTFNLAVAGTPAGRTLWVNCDLPLTANLAVPHDIEVRVSEEGSITQTAAFLLSFSGPFDSPDKQSFIGFSPNQVTFTGGSIKEVSADWWGTNTAPGTTDMANALNCASATKMRVRFKRANYHVNSSVIIYEGNDFSGAGNSQTGTVISADTAIPIIQAYAVTSGISEGFYSIRNMRIIGSSDLPTIGIQIGKAGCTTTNLILDNISVQGCLKGISLTGVQYSSFFDIYIEGNSVGNNSYTRGLELIASSVSKFQNTSANGFVNNLYAEKSATKFEIGSFWAEAGQTHTTSLVKIVNSRDIVFNGVVFENNLGDMNEILLDSTDTNYETNNIVFNDCLSSGSAGPTYRSKRFMIGVSGAGHFDIMNIVLNRHQFIWRYFVSDVDVTSGHADGVTLNKCMKREDYYGEHMLNPSVIGNLSASKVHIIPAEEFWAAEPTSASIIAHPWELGMRVYQSDALLSGADGNQGWVVARHRRSNSSDNKPFSRPSISNRKLCECYRWLSYDGSLQDRRCWS